MIPYNEINAHHIGSSHVQSDLICEDYSASYGDENISIAVISDGHGDKNCFRSSIGAKIACHTAIELCKQFQTATSHINDIDDVNIDDMLTALEKDIAESWKAQVINDYMNKPFTEEELINVSENAKENYLNGNRIEKAYGCTLIVSVILSQFWFALQIGDGKCVAAYEDGVYVEPIPIDINCVGNRSTSLCNSNASEIFRHYYSKILPIAVFVSSDGVEESFDQKGLNNCFYSIAYWIIKDGIQTAREKLIELLPQISQGGSGDDVSVSGIVSIDNSLATPRQSLTQVYERLSDFENALSHYKEKLEYTAEQLENNLSDKETLENDINELEQTLSEKREKHQALSNECDKLQTAVKDITEKLEKTEAQIENAEKFKTSAESFWLPKLDKLGIVLASPEDEEDEEEAEEENSLVESEDESINTGEEMVEKQSSEEDDDKKNIESSKQEDTDDTCEDTISYQPLDSLIGHRLEEYAEHKKEDNIDETLELLNQKKKRRNIFRG